MVEQFCIFLTRHSLPVARHPTPVTRHASPASRHPTLGRESAVALENSHALIDIIDLGIVPLSINHVKAFRFFCGVARSHSSD